MDFTEYHAKYFASELSKNHPAGDPEILTATLADAQVDLNPHQINAALFFFKSPFTKGVILADEVGLGKTIEAGLILSQKWARQQRKLIIIAPSTLRKQWQQELREKFFLPSIILDSEHFHEEVRKGNAFPFDQHNQIIICSYHFARNQESHLSSVPWDLVVMDEAHRVRNVYKPTNKIGRTLRNALRFRRKLLLTATPLQNSLMELFGLVSFIDEEIFGDADSFRAQFTRLDDPAMFHDLKERLRPICHRTLRQQVREYISYTNRIPLTEEFTPTPEESTLYDDLSSFLQQDELVTMPAQYRPLIILVLRKLLASSTFAIAGALETMIERLTKKLDASVQGELPDFDDPDLELLEEITDEVRFEPEEIDAAKEEIAQLQELQEQAAAIKTNAKGTALLTALETAFSKLDTIGAPRKAMIFTESRKTQEYLSQLLTEAGFGEKLVLFNGTNDDERSREIYSQWLTDHLDSDMVTGIPATDMRTSLVDFFREEAEVMIATEAAAEGINLQFCSLIVNFDLPWNPQRIEQRIGRCHRYGQKFDVVIVNFLNQENAVDQRVFELLSEKFQLFDGVFGASDQVVGTLGNGIVFERRIAAIYQDCRSADEIKEAFDVLQSEMDQSINEAMGETRESLLEHFDAEVHEKLKVNLQQTEIYLNKHDALLWELTRFALRNQATFDEEKATFSLTELPAFAPQKLPTGTFSLTANEDARLYRPGHPLAQWILQYYKDLPLKDGEVHFHYSDHPISVASLDPFKGKEGYLALYRLTVHGIEKEDILQLGAIDESGEPLEASTIQRLFTIAGTVKRRGQIHEKMKTQLYADWRRSKEQILKHIAARHAEAFENEMEKLDRWAEDKRRSLQSRLKEMDKKRKEVKKESSTHQDLSEKIKFQEKLRKINQRRDEAWKQYDQDCLEIDSQKDALITDIKKRLEQTVQEEVLFYIRWKIV